MTADRRVSRGQFMEGGAFRMTLADAIRSRHAKDLIVGECKDGPTWFGPHLRLDYWVLRRSWSKPAMIGYEVKSSRSDFLADKKWTDYLPLCNELWFIADPRHIQPGELPDSVGHLRLAGSRLITVRRAVWREIEPPVSLLLYILMSRTTIDALHEPRTLDEWRTWLAERQEKRSLGYQVAKALREKYERDVGVVQRENEELRREIARLTPIKTELEARAIDWTYRPPADVANDFLRVKRWDRQTVEHARDVLVKLLNGGTSE